MPTRVSIESKITVLPRGSKAAKITLLKTKYVHITYVKINLIILIKNYQFYYVVSDFGNANYSLVSIISTVRLVFQGFDFQIVQYV